MANLYFQAGARITFSGSAGVIHSYDAQLAVLLLDDGRHFSMTPQELALHHRDGTVTLQQCPPSGLTLDPILTDEQIEEMEWWLAYCRALDAEYNSRSRRVIASAIDAVFPKLRHHDRPKPSGSTVYRVYRRWVENDRSPLCLITSKLPCRRKKRISPEVVQCIDEILDRYYLVRQGASLAECYRVHLPKALADLGLSDQMPGHSYFYARAGELDPVEVVLLREGKEAARRFAPVVGNKYFADYPLQRVEMDAVHLKIGIISEGGKFLGTIVLYLIIDCFSRCILGYSYTIAKRPAEQAADAIRAIKHAIVPKDPAAYPHLQNKWECHGKMAEINMDASPAHTHNAVASFLAHLGISRIITETKKPQRRPFIERFHRTLRAQLAAKLPGYGGSRTETVSIDGTLEQLACVTPAQFETCLEEYLVDGYHQTSHRGLLDNIPAEVWRENIFKYPPVQLTPSQLEYLSQFGGVLRGEKRVKKGQGIQLDNIHYNSRELQTLYWRLSRDMDKPCAEVITDPYDVSKICVVDPTSQALLQVPNTSGVEPGTTAREFQARRAAQRGRYRREQPISNDHPEIRAAKEVQRKKAAERKRAKHPPPEDMTEQTPEQLASQVGLERPSDGTQADRVRSDKESVDDDPGVERPDEDDDHDGPENSWIE